MSDMSRPSTAAQAANRMRAEHLLAVHEGMLTPLDVLKATCSEDYLPLRTIKLSQLFGPLDRCAPASARKSHVPWRIVRPRLLAALELDLDVKAANALSIGWILDSRAGGRRWFALCDALRPRDKPPWPGFPWTPPPPAPQPPDTPTPDTSALRPLPTVGPRGRTRLRM